MARDDSLVAVGALEEKFWEEVIGVLAEVDPSISKLSSEAHLEEVFASRDGQFWREKLIPLDVCVEMVESPRPTAAIKPSGHASLEAMLKGWDIETEIGNDGFLGRGDAMGRPIITLTTDFGSRFRTSPK